MKWQEEWELPSIPDGVFWPEVGRRRAETAGRPKTLRECEYCHEQFGTAEMRLHKPVCPKNSKKRKARKDSMSANVSAVVTIKAAKQAATNYSPYVQLAVRVKNISEKMEKDANAIADLLITSAGRTRTDRENKLLNLLHNSMDKHEFKLRRYLNPEPMSSHEDKNEAYRAVINGYMFVLKYVAKDVWRAYSPDFPGFDIEGRTQADLWHKLNEGLPLHVQSLKAANLPIPAPSGKVQ